MWKKLLIAFVVLAVILLLSLDLILKRYVENEIRVWTENPESPYAIRYEKLKIEIFKGKVALKNLEIHYKSAVYDSLKEAGALPQFTYAVQLSFLEAEVKDWMELLFRRKFSVDHVVLHSPFITRYRQEDAPEKQLIKKQGEGKSRSLREFLDYFSLDAISIQNASVAQVSVGRDSIENFAINNINFTLNNLLISSEDFEEEGRFVLPDFEWDMENIHVRLSKTNHVNIGKVTVRKDKLYLSKVSLTNETPYRKFIARQKWRKAHLEMTADSISVDISRMLEYFFTNRLHIPAVSISGMKIELAVNPNRDFEDQNQPLVSKKIREIKSIMTIDTLRVFNSKVDLKILIKEDREPGQMGIDRMNITVLNITNDPERLAKNPWMEMHMTARNQKQGLMDVHLAFNIADKRDSFTAKGKMEGIDFAKFNTITKDPIEISFENGHLHRVSFDISGNNQNATGIVHFDYKDLEVMLLQTDEKEGESKGHFFKKMLSGLINGAIKTENLVDKKNYKYANVTIDKPLNKGHIGYILDVVSEGVLQITTRRGVLSEDTPKAKKREERNEKRKMKKEEKQKDN